MKSSRTLFTFCLMVLAVMALSGCYTQRLKRNYDSIPELESENSALLGSSEVTEEEAFARLKDLENIEKEPEAAYTINSGDNVAIMVYNHPDLAVKTTVTPDGYIGMVFAGQVRVAGLTLEKASLEIEKALSKYIQNPKVGISPYEIRSETVTIAGAVTHPGMYNISNGMRLADLIAKAGGSAARYYDGQTIDAADLDNSIFIRRGRVIPIDFSQAIHSGNLLHNLLLRKGDYIYIAARDSSMVYLIGDVRMPRRQVWSKDLGLLELLSIGGWVNDTYWKHAIIIRGGIAHPKMYKVDLDGILSGRKPNVLMQAGDIVYIPKDDISEYNVFVRKLLPTGQLMNMVTVPIMWHSQGL